MKTFTRLKERFISWLAQESHLNDIRALIPPKAAEDVLRLVRVRARSLPETLRGTFYYTIENNLKAGFGPESSIEMAFEEISTIEGH